MKLYTLVRHTGYSVGGNHAFRNAVEERWIAPGHAAAITKLGGRIFDDYTVARDEAERINYPPEKPPAGLIPTANGKFVLCEAIDEEVFIAA